MLLPISALSQRLRDNAPSLIGMLMLIALSVSLAWQSAELLRLVRSPVEQATGQTAPTLAQRSQPPSPSCSAPHAKRTVVRHQPPTCN